MRNLLIFVLTGLSIFCSNIIVAQPQNSLFPKEVAAIKQLIANKKNTEAKAMSLELLEKELEQNERMELLEILSTLTQNEPLEQEKFFLKTIDLLEKQPTPDYLKIAFTYQNLAYTVEGMNRWLKAVEYHNKALEKRALHLKTNVHADLLEHHFDKTFCAFQVKENQLAHQYAKDALAIAQEVLPTNHPEFGNIYNSLASTHEDNESAIRFLEKAAEIARQNEGENSMDLGIYEANIGALHLRLGDFDKALLYYEKSLPKLQSNPKETIGFIAINYYQRAYIYNVLNEYEKVIEIAKNGLEIPHAPTLLILHIVAGKANHRLEKYATAEQHFRASIELSKQQFANRPVQLHWAYLELSDLMISTGEFEKAKIYLDSSLYFNHRKANVATQILPKKSDEYIRKEHYRNSLWIKGKMFAATNNQDSALYYFKSALALTEALFDNNLYQENTATLALTSDYKMAATIEEFFKLYRKTKDEQFMEDAFYVSLKNKRYQKQWFFNNANKLAAGNTNANLLNQKNKLNEEIRYLDFKIKTLQQSGDSTKWLVLNDSLLALQQQLDAINAPLNQVFSVEPDSLLTDFSLDNGLSLADVQDYLKSDENLINFYLFENTLYAFRISKENIDWKIQNLKNDPIDLVNHFRDNILKKEDFQIAAKELFDETLGLFDDLTPKLFIIRNSILEFVPFEILVDEIVETDQWKDLNYVLKNHQINYISDLKNLFPNEQKGRPSNDFLVFAPSFPELENMDNQENIAMRERARDILGNLPGASAEAAFLQEKMKATVFLNDAATEANFRNNYENFNVLHFATHGILDPENQKYSRLLFSEKDPLFDGSLYTYEIYNLQSNADLVVLSACNTGLGKLRHGQSVESLGTAFNYAGSNNIVTSLWSVDDRSTAQLMANFYENMQANMPKPKALHQAKLAYLESSNNLFAHPYYWGGFVYYGENEPLRTGVIFHKKWWFWSLVILVLGLFAMQFFKFKKGEASD